MRRYFGRDGYYHLYNRGTLKQNIFRDERDYCRFLFLVFAYVGTAKFSKVTRLLGNHTLEELTNTLLKNKQKISTHRKLEVFCFCLMPNHFHLIVHELYLGAVSKYMQRILASYAKYFNLKYKQSGHVFQNSYQVKEIFSNTQFLNTMSYVHHNPKDIRAWKNNEKEYTWSSFQDYEKENRWENLLTDVANLGGLP